MSVLMILGLIGLSLAGLAYLALTDPKRRRTFNQKKLDSRKFLWPARVATFAPGFVLIAIGHWSGLAIWAGAVTTLGWVMAAVSPKTYAQASRDVQAKFGSAVTTAKTRMWPLVRKPAERISERFQTGWRSARNWTGATIEPVGTSEIVELKARITALEARLHRLEHGEEVPLPLGSEVANGQPQNASDATTTRKPLDAAE